MVGTSSGTIQLYDIASHQLLRTINNTSLKGHAITHLQTLLRPPDLVGHVSAGLGTAGGVVSGREVAPTRPIVPFQRIRDVKAREVHEVLITLPGIQPSDYVSARQIYRSLYFLFLFFFSIPKRRHAVDRNMVFGTILKFFLTGHVLHIRTIVASHVSYDTQPFLIPLNSFI